MPVLNTPEELIAVMNFGTAVDDPITELERRGYTLGPELSRQWSAVKKNAKPRTGAAQNSLARPRGPISFSTGKPLTPAPRDRAPGDYDFILGVRSELANEALAALYESGTVPHELALDELLSSGDLASLGAFFIVDRPGGTISHLLITSAPTMETIPGAKDFVAVNIPVRVNWDRTTHFGGVAGRSNVTFATGTLRLIVQVRALIAAGTMTLGLKLFTPLDSPAESPRLMIDANSPVQRVLPVPLPNQIDLLAVLIESGLRDFLQDSLVWTVSPIIPLSIGSIQIRQLDVSSVGDALIAGLNLDGTDGDVATFANLLPNDSSNVFLRTLDTVAKQLIKIALQDGTLTALAKQEYSNAEILSADAHFEAGAFVTDFNGHLVDECPLNVDLNFNSRRRIEVEFAGSQIKVTATDDENLWDSHNLLCLATAGGPIVLATIAGAWLAGFLGAVAGFAAMGTIVALGTDVGTLVFNKAVDALFDSGDPSKPTPINLTAAIPGTDRLPTIQDASFAIEDGALIITARASTRLDDLSTYLYAQFLVPHLSFHDGTPLVGARVSLMDQDAPAPPGDDVVLPPPKIVRVHDNIMTTTLNSYEPPLQDQVMLEGRTDINGIVRFALTEDQLLTGAGHVKQVITQADLVGGKEFDPIISHPVVFERRPDLYFRVFLPDGTAVDSRNAEGGLFVNAGPLRAGSLANPLTFFVTSGGLVLKTGGSGETAFEAPPDSPRQAALDSFPA